jgi:hypothetical protein
MTPRNPNPSISAQELSGGQVLARLLSTLRVPADEPQDQQQTPRDRLQQRGDTRRVYTMTPRPLSEARRRIWPDDPPSLAEVYPSEDSLLREIKDSVESRGFRCGAGRSQRRPLRMAKRS